MGTLTVRNLDDALKARLRVRAAEHGQSMEAEARAILRSALIEDGAPDTRLGSRIHARFAGLGAGDLQLPARTEPPRAAGLDA